MAPAPQSAVDALVREIAAYQDRQGFTDADIAAEIGVPRSTWQLARTGQYRPGLSFVQRVMHASPRFRESASRVLVPR